MNAFPAGDAIGSIDRNKTIRYGLVISDTDRFFTSPKGGPYRLRSSCRVPPGAALRGRPMPKAGREFFTTIRHTRWPRVSSMTTAKRWTTGLLAMALPALLLAAPARAIVTSGTPTSLHNDTDGDPEADRQAVSREIERFRSSTISIGQAMAIAERRHAGATTADVSFDGASGVPVYRVKTLHNDRMWRHTINASTGELVGGEAALPLAELDHEDRDNLAALGAIRHRLADAVRVAEQAASGKAISGGLVRERGRLNFAIVVISGDDLKEVILEPPGARTK
nr:PepSY domain-containing protein [Bradyrhizobium sp. AT1]